MATLVARTDHPLAKKIRLVASRARRAPPDLVLAEGIRVLEEATAAARDTVDAQRGLAFLTLHTGAANQPARSLYRRLGYHEEELLLTKAIQPIH